MHVPSIEELADRQDRQGAQMLDLSQRVTAIEMNHQIADVHRTNVEKRLAEIEDTLKWIVRLIIGAIVLALIGFVIQGNVIQSVGASPAEIEEQE